MNVLTKCIFISISNGFPYTRYVHYIVILYPLFQLLNMSCLVLTFNV
jgi:hypothetical protein